MAVKEELIEKIGKVTSASVKKCTGQNWRTWIDRLEKAGGRGLSHKELVAFLKKKYELNAWWQQGVATGFEKHIGRKIEGRNAKGFYSTMASRTLPLAAKDLWKYLESTEGQSTWLSSLSHFKFEAGAQFEVEGGVYGSLRTLKKPVRLRLRWQDEDWAKPSVLCVYLVARPGAKCILIFQHDQLPTDRARLALNERWKNVLTRLKDQLAKR